MTADLYVEPFRVRYPISSARDEPIPPPRSSTDAAPTSSLHISEADRLSKAQFETLFAEAEAEVAQRRALAIHQELNSQPRRLFRSSTDFLGRDTLIRMSKHNGKAIDASAVPGNPSRKSALIAGLTPSAKKRKAEANADTEHPVDTGTIPSTYTRKHTRRVTFADSVRKSSRLIKTRSPVVSTRGGGGEPVQSNKKVKLMETPPKPKVIPLRKKDVAVVATNATVELVEIKTTVSTRAKQNSSKRKSRATLPPTASETPSTPPSLTLVTLQSKRHSAGSSSSGSSTVVSPTSGHSRGSSTSTGTAVGSPVMYLKSRNGKRKRIDESSEAGVKAAGVMEEVVVSRSTTRASKTTVKAAAAVPNVSPVEGEPSNPKRQKTTNASRNR